MNVQDFFPFDATIIGLQNLYHTIGSDSFYINHPYIMVKDLIVTTGETYFFFERESDGHTINFRAVRLMDAFYYNQKVYILLCDIKSDEILIRHATLANVHGKYQWRIVDSYSLELILLEKELELNHDSETTLANDYELLF